MITFYLQNNPAYIGVNQPFQVGFIDTDGTLTDITNVCAIELLEPIGGAIVDTNNIVVNSVNQNVTVYLKVTYLTYDPEYFSFCFVQQLLLANKEKLYKTFVNYLPQNVYDLNIDPESPIYVDNNAAVEAIAQLYELSAPILVDTNNPNYTPPQFVDLKTIVNRFFPDSGYPAWEQYLVGTNALYLQEDVQYAKLLQLFYQTNTNNDTNPYFIAWNISRYIFYRLGLERYVYIGEDSFSASGAFILDLNELSKCILLGENANPTTIFIYIINSNDLDPQFRHELELFIRRITRISMLVEVIYDKTFSDFGLISINDTYWKDPRQNNSYCIQFNEYQLAQALGYTSGGSTIYVTSFTVTLDPPAPGNILTLGQTYSVLITPTFSRPTILPKDIIFYTEFFSSDQNVVDFYLDSGVEYFVAESIGDSIMNVYLGTISQSITYTVV